VAAGQCAFTCPIASALFGFLTGTIGCRALVADSLISEQLADRTLSCGDSFRSVEGDSRSGGPTMSLERPFPARRIDRLDDRVFNTLMFQHRRSSATAANILQLCSGSGLFRKEWILVSRRRGDTVFGRFRDLWWKRRIVTGEARTGALDRAAIRFRGGRR
jgi:hypothetical protein